MVLSVKPRPSGMCVIQGGEEDVVSPVPLSTSTRKTREWRGSMAVNLKSECQGKEFSEIKRMPL